MASSLDRFWIVPLALAIAACSSTPEGAPLGTGATPEGGVALSDTDAARARVVSLRSRFGEHAAGLFQRGVRYVPRGGSLRATFERAHATVDLPIASDGWARVGDDRSGAEVRFRLLETAPGVAATVADGLVIYPGAAPGGGDVLHRPTAEGTEDYVVVPEPPGKPTLRYSVDVSGVEGLRLVQRSLELIDAEGAPRLRVAPPYVIDARGQRHEAELEVSGCSVDRDPRPPFGRAPVGPGASHCELEVRWPEDVPYPVLVDPAWVLTDNMAYSRRGHGAARLNDGRVLVAGGSGSAVGLACEVWDPATGTWAGTSPLGNARNSFVLVTLTDDRVLAVGPHNIAVAEAWDPSTGNWSPLPGPTPPVSRTQAVRLADGRVLVPGGFVPAVSVTTAEIFDPGTDTWSGTGPMNERRNLYGLALLSSGKVLVAGGWVGQSGAKHSTAELYDPATNTWVPTGSMAEARTQIHAARLDDGRVLVAGGLGTGFPEDLSTAEIYDPSTEMWSPTDPLSQLRRDTRLIPLQGGQLVLAAAGSAAGSPISMTQVFHRKSGTWFDSGDLAVNRGASAPSHTLLSDDRVLLAGGGNITATAEVFDFVAAGDGCAIGGECESGICVEGVCCDTTCSGTCESCLASVKGSGSDGTCGPIANGTDPKAECGACEACNGSGACTPVSAGADPKNDCLDSGSPACTQNGSCDGAGGCQLYPASSGCAAEACTSGSQCVSGFCRDGICCDGWCLGACQACTAALKGGGQDGVCGTIAAGTDPESECPQDSGYPASCGADGSCDGSGACRSFAVSGTSCASSSCSVPGTLTEFECNGAGGCLPIASSCGPYACLDATACRTSCTATSHCQAGAYCSGGACIPQKPVGDACAAADECTSGACVDGVCCESTCAGTCQACSALAKGYGADGVCDFVKAATDPRDDCPDDGALGCGLDGLCNGMGACRLYPAGTACGDTSCSGNAVRGEVCNGLGDCITESAGIDCAPHRCLGDECANPCTGDPDCIDTAFCDSGVCTDRLSNGQPCTTSNECDSGFCVDGVCCDSPCTGQCEACGESGTVGLCTPTSGEPRAPRAPCAGAGGECGGSCDGATRAVCQYPASGTSCGSRSCADGVAIASECNGQGDCVEGESTCEPYVCGADACLDRCDDNEDCARAFKCDTEMARCIPASGRCVDGDTAVEDSSGNVASCAPYLCAGGSCRTACSSTLDCASGSVCDQSGATGACVPSDVKGDAEDDGGCGCAVPGHRGGPGSLLLGVVTLVAALRRSRSRQRLRFAARSGAAGASVA